MFFVFLLFFILTEEQKSPARVGCDKNLDVCVPSRTSGSLHVNLGFFAKSRRITIRK
jgi:hypothetical protein